MIAVIFPVIKQNMSQTSSNQGSQNSPYKQGVQFVHGFIFAFENIFHDVPTQAKSNYKHQTVKANYKKAQINSFRWIPNYI